MIGRIFAWLRLFWLRQRVKRRLEAVRYAEGMKVTWECEAREREHEFHEACEDRNWHAERHGMPATPAVARQQKYGVPE